MISRDNLSIGFLSFIVSLPMILIATLSGSRTELITDSIPDHKILLGFLFASIIASIAVLNRRVLFEVRPASGILTALFALSSIMLLIGSTGYYNAIYERYLFRSGGDFNARTVRIDRVSRVDHRGGDDFFGYVNPNNLGNLQPKIFISESLYDLWRKTAASDAQKSPGNASPWCTVRVIVNRDNNAERIVWQKLIDVSDVVECR